MRREELIEKVRRLGYWYHNVHLGNGVWTNPNHPEGNYPQKRWDLIEPFVPESLEGKTVLDIGCNSGFFSLKMKERGASYVLGTDSVPDYLAQAEFLASHFNLEIEYRMLNVYDIDKLGMAFDFVIFLGVLYHLRHPLYALDKIAEICRDVMLFASVMRGPAGKCQIKDNYAPGEDGILEHPNFPKMYFIEKSYYGDSTNWWFPNRNAAIAMIRSAGFKSVHFTSNPEVFVCYRNRVPKGAIPIEEVEKNW
jgi:tRNA (mo5U34)-methyltransferase